MDILRQKFAALLPALNERGRRLAAAAEALSLGYGGVAKVARASGVSVSTIWRGLRDLKKPGRRMDASKVRRPGGGRKNLLATEPRLATDLDSLVEPATRGDPESPLRWTCKSLRVLSEQLQAMGHAISYPTVGSLLHQWGYSLQANQKVKEGAQHPDRNAQFEYIYREIRRQQSCGQPVISVDTKKKELVGDFKNAGREWRPRGKPQRVRVHDFLLPAKGHPVRRVRLDEERRLGERRHRPRHGGVRGQQHPALVAHDGASGVSAGSYAVDNGGFWGQQQRADPAVEMGAPAPRHAERLGHFRAPSPARDEQVEQDRAPAVFVHQQ